MLNGAHGGSTVRGSLGSIALIFLFVQALTTALNRRSRQQECPHTGGQRSSVFYWICAVYAAALGLVSNPWSPYYLLDLYPLIEFALIVMVTQTFTVDACEQDISNFLFRLLILLGVMAAFDLIIYFILTNHYHVSFGVLRAYVNGATVNRLMDFLVPIGSVLGITFALRRTKHRRTWIPFVTSVLCFAVTALSYYRSVYVAVALILFLVIFYLRAQIFRNAFQIMLLGLVFTAASLPALEHSKLKTSVEQRFSSIFESEDSHLSNAVSGRLAQYPMILTFILDHPLGHGAGAFIQDETPVFVTSNYFLQLIMQLGLPLGGIFVLLILCTFGRDLLRALMRKYAQHRLTRVALVSITGVLIVELSLFPYVVYFPMMLILGISMTCSQRLAVIERRDSRI